ncbi:cyclin-domain-containing protein [Lentinula aciculospora]|uniref:Cyclin-domain-containing protein n=1 Tax=Lentinula aciculospora TaxID=153920 RepID=A0A9W9APH9_9AGAR|nr:cyclin-domain-containing protein [Lentinula aciculospora]
MAFAFNTPASLVRTPSDFIMNTLPSLPTEILTSWSVQWRQPKTRSPYSSPRKFDSLASSTSVTTLPSIAFLDKQLSDRHTSLLSSFEDLPPPHYTPPPPSTPTRLPPMVDYVENVPEFTYSKPPVFTDTNFSIDWLDFTHKRSAHFIAEKTCEMICYLWFTTPSSDPNATSSSSLFSRPNSATTLQLVASPTFVSFMQKLLETTQVSQSVIVLSLHYIYRLKERNRFTPAQAGSEFRIAVAGLMMANKFLDDNTYTNKTWSEVSGIELTEINRMEREFLMGVDCNLYVDKPTYESWLNLLKGLVLAKERDSKHYHKSRSSTRAPRHPGSSLTNTPHRYANRGRTFTHRARSTSPEQSHRTLVHSAVSPHYAPHVSATHSAQSDSPFLRSGAKRTAGAAFSPTSATFSHVPFKRPVSISLLIPESRSHSGPNSNSPLESLQSFARMSIDSPNAPGSRSSHATTISTAPSTPSCSSAPKEAVVPETLSAAYALDERRRSSVPQNLYFYALACSPTDDEENRSRKGKLRYHQPPPLSSSVPYYQPRPSFPVNVQSASTSPVHITVVTPTLPHFHDTNWTRQPAYTTAHDQHTQPPLPPHLLASAPFANAGPPGFQFCPTPEQGSSPIYERPHRSHAWSRRSICE